MDQIYTENEAPQIQKVTEIVIFTLVKFSFNFNQKLIKSRKML